MRASGELATSVAALTHTGGSMAGTEPLTEKKDAKTKAALEDDTVRLVYDLYDKLDDMVEQMQEGDDGMDDEEMAELHEAENALLGRTAEWLQARGVSAPCGPDCRG